MKKRTFTAEFKRQLVEEILHGKSRIIEVCRKYNISRPVLWRWQKLYEQGRLTDASTQALPMQQRINELERIVGRLTMDNELLKKAIQQVNGPAKKSEIISGPIELTLGAFEGGVEC